ncbi:undecaprenyl-phosphate alpha-N-acetylglucosaminyl 1-phosphate transferase [Pseudoalteromonas sp. KS88]|uniref:UDP-N-acetylglucosamine--undecaprenyl-phosphate N-acetylglucosaminephosphotransferase n=1 Tax=Pseudoalteromonas sp. KS88 TaxID=2109918 RepID=UPI001081F2F2|nr:UDP-N-acetylglucosamine--undecaprenyl-phosphate N-acetylglucosaminephosphotransferase [Pseudoalteromonas sp. KS88]TGE79860.1 undecaprenyl-phosphate alpha-N-acetylglucosaminyl 1-phosphate transferase [Pseudoalteromonas sp. KS88]
MNIVLPLLIAFTACFFAIWLTKPMAIKTGLVDIPNGRKIHDGQVPLIGGVAIYIGVFLSSILFFDLTYPFKIYLIASALTLVLGVFDDKFSLSVRLRVIIQVAIAMLMIYQGGVSLNSLGLIFGFFEASLDHSSIVITVIAVIAAINAFNMVDGIDGLAGVLSVITFIALGILLWVAGSVWYLLALLFIAAIIAFLLFNLRWPTRAMHKVFMGDAGSMLIGFTIVWLLLIGADKSVNAFKPVTALYLIAIPLMDMAAIMYRRVKKGTSPFKPDREHLHHIFERAGCSRKRSLIIIALMAVGVALLGGLMDFFNVPEWIMLLVFLIIFFSYSYALFHVWRILSWIRKNRTEANL